MISRISKRESTFFDNVLMDERACTTLIVQDPVYGSRWTAQWMGRSELKPGFESLRGVAALIVAFNQGAIEADDALEVSEGDVYRTSP